MTQHRMGVYRLLAICVVGAALYLAPVLIRPTAVPFWGGAGSTDLLVAHLPSAMFIHRAVATWREIPLWNPMILSGIPFAADPLSGLWYPPLWFAALWPRALTFNVLSFVHIVWAGFGLGLLLRRRGLPPWPAWIGAAAFAGAPKLIGHVAVGHVTLAYAVSWMPWLLLATHEFMASPGSTLRAVLRRSAPVGGCLGLVFLVDPRWALPSALVSLAYGVRCWVEARQPERLARRHIASTAVWVGLIAAGISAGLALPLAEWVGISTRAGLADGASSFSLPPGMLLGLLVPQHGAWPEWLVSPGIIVLFLGAMAVAARGRSTLFWVGLVTIGWLFSLGDGTPIGTFVTRLPGLNLLRVPPRWLLASALGLCVLAAEGADVILGGARDPRVTRRLRLVGVSVTVAVVALGVAIALLAPEGAPPWPLLLVGPLAASAALVLILLGPRSNRILVAVAWTALLAADLALLDWSLLDPRPEDIVFRPDPAAAFVSRSVGDRVFTTSYAIPQHIAMRLGIELADGIHPLQIRSYVEWMAAATGFDPDEYSVTLPPFTGGDPKVDWGPDIDADALGKLGVAWIISEHAMTAGELDGPVILDGAFVYRNPKARPRSWVERDSSDWTPAEITLRSPNTIIVTAQGPGRLVFSEVAYPGWKARLDGVAVPLQVEEDLFRAVDLPPGPHTVRLDFRPYSVYVGLALMLATLTSLLVLWRRTP